MIDLAKKYANVEFRHAAALWNAAKHPLNLGSYFGYPLIAQCSRQSTPCAWLEVKGAPIRGCVVARLTVSGSIAAPRHR